MDLETCLRCAGVRPVAQEWPRLTLRQCSPCHRRWISMDMQGDEFIFMMHILIPMMIKAMLEVAGGTGPELALAARLHVPMPFYEQAKLSENNRYHLGMPIYCTDFVDSSNRYLLLYDFRPWPVAPTAYERLDTLLV